MAGGHLDVSFDSDWDPIASDFMDASSKYNSQPTQANNSVMPSPEYEQNLSVGEVHNIASGDGACNNASNATDLQHLGGTTAMRDEVVAAARFITRIVEVKSNIPLITTFDFNEKLMQLIANHYVGHWYPLQPWRGQAFRCLLIHSSSVEPLIQAAANLCGLKYKELNLPPDMIVWVDPGEVTCRIGEQWENIWTILSKKDGESKSYVESLDVQEMLTNNFSKPQIYMPTLRTVRHITSFKEICCRHSSRPECRNKHGCKCMRMCTEFGFRKIVELQTQYLRQLLPFNYSHLFKKRLLLLQQAVIPN